MSAQPARRFFLTGLLLLPSLWMTSAQAQLQVSPEMYERISSAASASYAYYPADTARHDELLRHIDAWADARIGLNNAREFKGGSPQRSTWVIERAVNTPLFPAGEPGRGLSPEQPFRIKYVKKAAGRSFVKSIRMPVSRRMDEEQVIKTGRHFIEAAGFVVTSEADRIGEPMVIARLLDVLQPGSTKPKTLVVLQRAIFSRSLDGLEVFNSRQIVDVHPETGEILAWKGLDWAPAQESGRKAVKALPAEQLLDAIKNAYRDTASTYHVTAVNEGMYQSAEMIFPVLAVTVERQADKSGQRAPKRTLYIPLTEIGGS